MIALITAGFLAHVGWRLWLASHLPAPIVHTDEDRYLLFARVLAGGDGGWGGDTQATRRAGYPLLLAPLYWVTSDAFTVYRAVQGFNAVLNALAFPLAYLFARRVLNLKPALAGGIAFAVAAMPAVVFFAPFALPNVVLTPLLLGWLLAMHAWLTGRTGPAQIRAAAVAGAVLGFTYVVHVRALLLLPAYALIVGVAVLQRRIRLVSVGVSVAAAGLMMLWHPVLKAALADKMVTGGTEPENRMLEAFTTAEGLLRMGSDSIGQIWYMAAASWGLAAIGLTFVAFRLATRRELASPKSLILAALLGSTLLIAIVTASALPDDGKLNNHLYPGYVIFLAPMWVLVGVGVLQGSARRAGGAVACAAAFTVATWFVVETNIKRRPQEWFSPIDAPELSFLANNWTSLHLSVVTRMTVLFLAVALALAMARRWLPRLSLTVLVLAMTAINVWAVHAANTKMAEFARYEYATAPHLTRDVKVVPGDRVASSIHGTPWYNHQREVYWTPLQRFDALKQDPPADATIVIANVDAGWGATPRAGWQLIGGDPVHRWAVWRRTS